MSAPTLLQLINAEVVFADTQAGLGSGVNYSCQVTSAAVNIVDNDSAVPATFCEGPSSVPGKPGYELAIAWLQDWNASGGGLSKYLNDNKTLMKWFRFKPIAGAEPTCIGQVMVKGGALGGEGGGAPAPAATTMRLLAEPAITVPA